MAILKKKQHVDKHSFAYLAVQQIFIQSHKNAKTVSSPCDKYKVIETGIIIFYHPNKP